jgi:cation transport regulator ChaC
VGGLSTPQWVFGYASLVHDHAGDTAVPAALEGWRRTWGVATDNTRSIPGYKMYLDRRDGSRPAVYVAFLDVEPDPDGRVRGLATAVDDEHLAALDLRERNYDRTDVSSQVEGVEGTVWTYVGSRDGRARLREGIERAATVISRDYLEKVQRGFGGLDDADPIPDGLPVWDLDRVDLPA